MYECMQAFVLTSDIPSTVKLMRVTIGTFINNTCSAGTSSMHNIVRYEKITDSKVSTYHSKQNRVIHQSLSVSSSTAGRSMYMPFAVLGKYSVANFLKSAAFAALIGRGYL